MCLMVGTPAVGLSREQAMIRFLILIALVAGACDANAPRVLPVAADTAATPAVHVDSIFTTEEEQRRFRADLPAVERLAGGADSREALVTAYVSAVEQADTAALDALLMTRAEFAYLYFPTSPYTAAPYKTPPWLLWLQIEEASIKGRARALQRLSGHSLGYDGHTCERSIAQGENRIWEGCRVSIEIAPGDRRSLRLFGAIIEHNGAFKVMSWASDL